MNRTMMSLFSMISVATCLLLLTSEARCQFAEPDVLAQDLSQPTLVEGKKIAFVFEDGPLPQTTSILLDALKKLGMKATFAVSGQNVESNPGLARRIVAEGHEMANHTYSLPDLKRSSPEQLIREIRAAEDAIKQVTGVKPRFFRATNGELSESLRDVVQKEGYEVLSSTLDSGDWRNPSSEKLMRDILKGAKPGSVILAHDSFPKSVKSMPAVFDALAKRGFLLCTASDLYPLGSNQGASSPLQPSLPSSDGTEGLGN
ncbi:MAG: polysaccharide deacetylase family protein [Terrimicrobiaceae bacterium]